MGNRAAIPFRVPMPNKPIYYKRAMEQDNYTIEEVNDATPDNYSEFGNGHKLKKRIKYTDGEPPHEEDEDYMNPEKPYEDIPKEK